MKTAKFFLVIVLLLTANYAFSQFVQEPLPYAYDALKPFIDARTMEIHYGKHHAGYVSNLNKALEETGKAPASLEAIFADISAYNITIRNNAGGHYNHTMFGSVLTPEKGTMPSATLAEAIDRDFGGMEELKKQFRKIATNRFGSGWAWLVVTPEKHLALTSTPNQDNPLMEDVPEKGLPIFGADVWEHAYYLKYQNKRGDYLDALWNIINWKEVSRRYQKGM